MEPCGCWARANPGRFSIFQWDSTKGTWEPYGTYGAVEITEAAGVPWIVQSYGNVYSKAPPITSSAPVDMGTPAPTPQAQPPTRRTESGKRLCSATATWSDCTDTKADYVGKYSLDTSCDYGFLRSHLRRHLLEVPGR